MVRNAYHVKRRSFVRVQQLAHQRGAGRPDGYLGALSPRQLQEMFDRECLDGAGVVMQARRRLEHSAVIAEALAGCAYPEMPDVVSGFSLSHFNASSFGAA